MMPETWNETLDAYSACDKGRQALYAVIGDLDSPMPCDWPWALAVLSSSPHAPTYDYIGWGVGRLVDWADVGVVAGADLRGVDLRSAKLRSADLRDADLRGADLQDADLRDADLQDADLRDADLDGARRDPSDPAVPGWAVVDGRLRRA